MLNLFSIFDYFYFYYSYMFLFLFLYFYMNFWVIMKKNYSLNMFMLMIFEFFFKLNFLNNSKNIVYMNLILFIFLFMLNILGIFPYYFSMTSQMNIVFLISMSIWLMINLLMILKNFKNFMAHCIPEGTPMILVPFLFLIELISNMIRPLTLTLRLIGNMVAGHIFLSLIFMIINNFSSLGLIFYSFYYLVETVICVLQAYIMFTLISMYYSEL